MLFNSAGFLFVFLPVTLLGFYLLADRRRDGAIAWLLAASLVFYGAWDPRFVALIVASVAANYLFGLGIERAGDPGTRRRRLVAGLVFNLGALGYFKYFNFFLDTLDALGAAAPAWPRVVLPIGISFFTFQQIAFLVDTFRGQRGEASFARYALFVTLFPHLIAGPITHHREIIPQLGQPRSDRWSDFAAGLTLLAIGLFKKTAIADTVAGPASAVFGAAAAGQAPSLLESWMAVSCYTLQIYFDFSAYSDMAVGLGRMLGVEFPVNFASPYKARSIVDFWRRWHITLSRFLRDYLYIPLGGNRMGRARQRVNLMVTMTLGGLWHGANWTFVLWGVLHGLYLLVNHAWSRSAVGRRVNGLRWWPVCAWVLTLLGVMLAWVPFRAKDLATAVSVWRGMIGLNGYAPAPGAGAAHYLTSGMTAIVLMLFVAVVALPSSNEIMRAARMGTPTRGYPASVIADGGRTWWRMGPAWAAATGALLFVAVMKLYDVSEFIYFQF
jgi:D-alanyl-lipoteichoic acid acyltransferase DltB (MBOAT superfamily)